MEDGWDGYDGQVGKMIDSIYIVPLFPHFNSKWIFGTFFGTICISSGPEPDLRRRAPRAFTGTPPHQLL